MINAPADSESGEASVLVRRRPSLLCSPLRAEERSLLTFLYLRVLCPHMAGGKGALWIFLIFSKGTILDHESIPLPA